MSARFGTTGSPPIRTVVAAWLIAVQVLLTASVSAMLSGAGTAGAAASLLLVPSGPVSAATGDVTAIRVAAVDTAAMVGGIDLDVAVLDLRTGESNLGAGPTAPMYAASLAKLVLAVDIVDRRRSEGLGVGAADVGLLMRALGPSDDLAMNELWTRFDGQNAVRRLTSRLGLTGTATPVNPSFWGQMVITAADLTVLYRHVLAMPQADRDLILGAIASAPPVAADGFAQDFGLLAPRFGGRAVAKQGWMCCPDGAGYLHSAGIVGDNGRFVVVLLSRQQPEPDWQTGRDRLTAVAVAVHEVLDTHGPMY